MRVALLPEAIVPKLAVIVFALKATVPWLTEALTKVVLAGIGSLSCMPWELSGPALCTVTV